MSAATSQRRPVTYLIPEGVALTIAYLMGHCLMFLNKGIYWDDWMYYRQSWPFLEEVSSQLGSIWPSWTFAALYHSDVSIWTARAAVAVCYLLAAVWFLEILRDIGIDRSTRLVMAICFALFPVNGARIPLASAAYGFSLALFIGGFRLVVASMNRSSILLRSLGAIALFLSLRTASFGMLLPIVYVFVIWREGAIRNPRLWGGVAVRHVELLIIPIAYLTLRHFVFVPYGVFAGYNAVSAGPLYALPRNLAAATWHSLFEPLMLGVSSVASLGGVAAAFAAWLVLLLGTGMMVPTRLMPVDSAMTRNKAACWFVVGLSLVLLALIPYLIVGKMPALSDFESRHQLLVPIGAAIIMGAGLRLTFGNSRTGTMWMLVVAAVLCGGFVSADIQNNISYLRERYKHIAMVDAMRSMPEFRTESTFLFDDRTDAFNANKRTVIRVSEYSGMMNLALGGQTRFGADADQYASMGMAAYRPAFTQWEKMANYRERPVQSVIEVVEGELDLGSTKTVLGLLAIDVLTPSRLAAASRDAVRLLPKSP